MLAPPEPARSINVELCVTGFGIALYRCMPSTVCIAFDHVLKLSGRKFALADRLRCHHTRAITISEAQSHVTAANALSMSL